MNQYVEVSQLSNYLILITERSSNAHSFGMQAFVKVGSADEHLPEDGGICHMLERLMFKGTDEYSESEILSLPSNMGGGMNAYTTPMYTKYYSVVPHENIEQSIALMDSVVFRPLLNLEDLEKEKNIVVEEINNRLSDPVSVAYSKARKNLFPNLNSSLPILGTIDTVSNFKITRVREYFRSFYRPQTIILVLYGNLPEQDVLEDILYENARGFVRKTRAANTEVLPRTHGDATPCSKDVYEEEEWNEIKNSTNIICYPIIIDETISNKKDYLTTFVLSTIIGRMSNSMMDQALRQKNSLAYTARSGNDYDLNRGVFWMTVNSVADNVGKANQEIDGIIDTITQGKVSDDIVNIAKNKISGMERLSLDSIGSNAVGIASKMCYLKENVRMFSHEVNDIMKDVSKKDIIEMANKIFSMPYSQYVVLNK